MFVVVLGPPTKCDDATRIAYQIVTLADFHIAGENEEKEAGRVSRVTHALVM